jgi:hypothetical protein
MLQGKKNLKMTAQKNTNPHPVPYDSGEYTPNVGGITLNSHGRIGDSLRDLRRRCFLTPKESKSAAKHVEKKTPTVNHKKRSSS